MNCKTVAAAAVLATLGSSAFAQAYVGIALGTSHSCVSFDVVGRCADNATTAKALVGYTLPGTDFAIEGIYDHLGTFKGTSQVGGPLDVTVQTFGVGGAWRPQFGAGWGGVVRGGVQYGKSRSNGTTFQLGTPITLVGVSTSQHFVQPYAGAGVSYAITPRIRLEADLDFTRIKGAGNNQPENAASYLLGATFGF
jgi:hypothetical protein